MKWQILHDPHLDRELPIHRTLERLLRVVMVLLLLAVLGTLGYQISVQRLPFEAMTYTFSSLVLLHAIYLTGWARGLTFFGLTLVISFLMEYLGVKTGQIFGAYHYTDVLNPKLLGTVPIVIPLAYFMVLHPSRMMADLCIWGRAAGTTKNLAWSLFTATIAGLVMTAWDLVMDPVMVHAVKAWVWEDGGSWFGVPFRNFFGWWLTTCLITLAAELLEPLIPLRPLGRLHRWVIALPLLGYASLLVGDFFVGIPLDTRVVAPFTMGPPLIAALLRLWDDPLTLEES